MVPTTVHPWQGRRARDLQPQRRPLDRRPVRPKEQLRVSSASPARESSTKPAEPILATATSTSPETAKPNTRQQAGNGTYNLSAGCCPLPTMGGVHGRWRHGSLQPNRRNQHAAGGILRTRRSARTRVPGYITSTPGCSRRTFIYLRRDGHLQLHRRDAPGDLPAMRARCTTCTPITVGTAASNVATVDANGQIVMLNSNFGGALRRPFRPRQLDRDRQRRRRHGHPRRHVLVQRHTSDIFNSYTGGTTVLSGTLELVNSDALPPTGVLTVGSPGPWC